MYWSLDSSLQAGHRIPGTPKTDLTERQKVLTCTQEIFKVDANQIQLNKQLCRYLRKQLGKTSNTLEYVERDSQEEAWRELYSVVKHVEDLQHKCMCKERSWLDAAIDLANIKAEVIEILLDLSWWTHMVKIASDSSRGSEAVQRTAESAVKKYETLYEKLQKEDSSLQKAAERDTEDLRVKLETVQKERQLFLSEESITFTDDREYILATYLLSRIGGVQIAPEVDLELQKYSGPIQRVGSGAYGTVHEVKWFNKNCALKNIAADGEEATLLKSCSHPHIVQLFWHWQDTGKGYSEMIMELMPGTLLTHIMRQNATPLPFHMAIDIMLQIAKAMRYLHNKKPQKIVHRDLKPSNILMTTFTNSNPKAYVQVKLADFGTSKIYNKTETSSKQTPNLGTIVYAAPEVFTEEVPGLENNNPKFPPKADVWSFAMVCSEILTCKTPFHDEKQWGLHARIREPGIRPQLPSDCPYDLGFCITHCWDLNPKMRPGFMDICKMLILAKARSLGIFGFETFKRLFPINMPMELLNNSNIPRPEIVAPLMSGGRYLSRFNFKQVEIIIKDFENKFGNRWKLDSDLYKGLLDGTMVEVTPFLNEVHPKDVERLNSIESFLDHEAITLRAIDHPNLVKLLGFCINGNEVIKVYESFPNGSLHKALLDWQPDDQHKSKLDWSTRLKIVSGIASGLEFVHERCGILHGHFNPRNILLDEKYNPHIAIYCSIPKFQSQFLGMPITRFLETHTVYIAPEAQKEITKKVDVFSFGIMVLEVMNIWDLYLQDQLEQSMETKELQHILKQLEKDNLKKIVERNPYCSEALQEDFHQMIEQFKKNNQIKSPRFVNSYYSNEFKEEEFLQMLKQFKKNYPIKSLVDDPHYSKEQAKRLVTIAYDCVKSNPEMRPNMKKIVKLIANVNITSNIS